MTPGEWYVVSDLHLAEGPGSRDLDAALPVFLRSLIGTSRSPRRSLVLLGDTFDLHGPVRQSRTGVAARLTALADAHAPTMAALAACVRSGVELHVVGGNHDIELTRPATAALFTKLLGLPAGHPGLRFSPWVVHQPGVFYAEHGNQHHELNRMPTVLSVREYDGCRAELPVPPLGAASGGHGWPATVPSALRVAGSLRSERRHEHLASSSWYQGLLAREAAELGLSGRALAEVAAVSRFGVATALAATARRAVERRLGVQRPGTFLAPRAAAIHRILTRHGVPAAAYVFGHNHRAERLELPDAPAAVYLNTGTWGADVRGRHRDALDQRLFPYARITSTPAGVDADLFFWRHAG